jgi:hypothetical protein
MCLSDFNSFCLNAEANWDFRRMGLYKRNYTDVHISSSWALPLKIAISNEKHHYS